MASAHLMIDGAHITKSLAKRGARYREVFEGVKE